jgi:hypothetical protein
LIIDRHPPEAHRAEQRFVFNLWPSGLNVYSDRFLPALDIGHVPWSSHPAVPIGDPVWFASGPQMTRVSLLPSAVKEILDATLSGFSAAPDSSKGRL